VEYLAATRIDPGHAEANTALALVAFTSGSPRPAKTMVDRALASRPGYPEALYVRGLVQAMGLHRPERARTDFEAYLEAAPFGSHRTTVQTLLTMIEKGGLP
jgi:Tfp pilus assembly protein PilF